MENEVSNRISRTEKEQLKEVLNMEETKEQIGHMPRIGEMAPAFEAVTTHGMLKLEDFKGSWLILFSHPADFTPVCTTEFMAFAKIYPELQKRGVELLGLSVDSVSSHIAWARNVEEKTGVKIPFPIIADQQGSLSRLWYDSSRSEQDRDCPMCLHNRPQPENQDDTLLPAEHRQEHG